MLRCASLATIILLATAATLPAQPAPSSPAPAPSAAAPSALPNSPDAMEDVQVGDHWTYEVKDEITGDIKATTTNTVTDVSTSEISTRVAFMGNPNFGFSTSDRSWNVTNNGVWRFTPNDGNGIRLPLAVASGDFGSVGGFDGLAATQHNRTPVKVAANPSPITAATTMIRFV